jgi:hypothetical protein
MIRSHLTCCLAALAFATASHAQRPVGPAPQIIDLGALRWGAVAKGRIAVENPRRADKRKECKGEHDFRISLDADAALFLELPADPTVYRVALGEKKGLPAVIDTNRLPRPPAGGVGFYEGIVTSTCLTCAGKCALERQYYKFSLTLLGPEGGEPDDAGGEAGGGEAERGGGPSGGGGGELPGGSDPRDESDAAPRCGPDVTKEFLEVLYRISARLDWPNWDKARDSGAAFKKLNPDRPLAVSPGGSCPRPRERCGNTVTLLRTCVPETMLVMILEGHLDELLGVPHPIAEPKHQNKESADSPEERRYLAAYGVGRMLGLLRRRDDLDARLGKLWSEDVATDEALVSPHRECLPCDEPATFSADWSLLVWNHVNGSLMRPPKAPGGNR